MTHRKISFCCPVSLLHLLVIALLFTAAFGGQNAFADLLSDDAKISASISVEGEDDKHLRKRFLIFCILGRARLFRSTANKLNQKEDQNGI